MIPGASLDFGNGAAESLGCRWSQLRRVGNQTKQRQQTAALTVGPRPAVPTSQLAPAPAARRSSRLLQVGQHRAGQHQNGDRRYLSGDPRQALSALSGRIRTPLQPPLRPRRHTPALAGLPSALRRCPTASSNRLKPMPKQDIFKDGTSRQNISKDPRQPIDDLVRRQLRVSSVDRRLALDLLYCKTSLALNGALQCGT